VGYFSDRFYVCDVTSGVTDALKKTPSVSWSNQLRDGLGSIVLGKPDLDTFLGKDLRKIRTVARKVWVDRHDVEPISVMLRVQ
jgi:hypothetical protein